MSINTFYRILIVIQMLVLCSNHAIAQQVPILNYEANVNGQVLLKVNSTNQHYYVLKVRHDLDSTFDIASSMVLGESDSTIISEALGKYPIEHYQVLEYPIATPFDTDGDSINDLIEYQNFPTQNPLNAAVSINFNNGLIGIDSFEVFKRLSVTKNQVQWSEFLNGKSFVKFIITDFNTANPKVYFINSSIHKLHADFANAIGINHLGDHVQKGQVIFHPKSISNNGTLGTFAFNYSNGHGKNFDVVQKTHELLAANMAFLENDFSYFVTTNSEDEFERDSILFQNSRIPVLFEKDVYATIDYWGLNQAEGYGFFRNMDLNEIPSPRDIVLYEALPNSLPRVGGIMTSVIQTPLSHVNLRAIQNEIPNAYIKNPLLIDSVKNLLNNYIYFKVEQDKYIIRLATFEEVNAWYDDVRPIQGQTPPLNLNYTSILPLDQINFSMFDAYGAKCANVATMGRFSFPNNTIPDGFGVPFYFYQEFMKYNQLFEKARLMISNPDFKSDRIIRDRMLKDFRKLVKAAIMPTWMLNKLDSMHQTFPTGTSIRCRSSSNNEDLPGFNGAGLYTSKTQHPHEGHISKSIKQVYASLWNLRAYEEREFYRVNHFNSSMGVLCHPNYSDEKSNGVGISVDPIYNTENTFYLNSQIGEELITNPDTLSIPEEIVLEREAHSGSDYIIVQRSNLIADDTIIMGDFHLDQMRTYLSKIHDEFAILYNATTSADFAMDIEYKITSENQLIIKQARPWVSYIFQKNPIESDIGKFKLKLYPNPATEELSVECKDCYLVNIRISDLTGRLIQEQTLSNSGNVKSSISVKELKPGVYVLSGFAEKDKLYHSVKFVKAR